MTRTEVERWKEIINQEGKVKLPEMLLNHSFNEEKGAFCVSLEVAKYISYSLPKYRKEALKIYLEELSRENIEKEIMEAKRNNGVNNAEDTEQLIETIVFSCYTACLAFKEEGDLKKALEFIKLGIQLVEEEKCGLGCLRIGDLYFEKWKVLEELGRRCELVDEIDELLFKK